MFLVAVGVLVGSTGTATADEGLVWRECHDGLRCTEVRVPAGTSDQSAQTFLTTLDLSCIAPMPSILQSMS